MSSLELSIRWVLQSASVNFIIIIMSCASRYRWPSIYADLSIWFLICFYDCLSIIFSLSLPLSSPFIFIVSLCFQDLPFHYKPNKCWLSSYDIFFYFVLISVTLVILLALFKEASIDLSLGHLIAHSLTFSDQVKLSTSIAVFQDIYVEPVYQYF